MQAMKRRNRARRPDQSMPAQSRNATWTGRTLSMASSARGSLIKMHSWQCKLLGDCGEMAVDLGLAHPGEARRAAPPGICLVDDHGANALIEVLSIRDARHDAPLRAHAVRKRPPAPAPHLRQRELQAARRLGADRRGDGTGPWRVGARGRCRGIEPHEYILDARAGEATFDRGAAS